MSLRPRPWISSISLVALAMLYLPLLAVAVLSVNAARHGVSWRGFTLNWYARLLKNESIQQAAWNTLVLAAASTLVATLLGTLLALGAGRFPWPRRVRALLDAVVYLPVVTPDIIFAAALLVAFGFLRQVSAYLGSGRMASFFSPGLTTMIIAHVTFQAAFVALVVGARLTLLGRTLEEAALDLYASRSYLMRRVTLPLLLPGIVAGAMLAFTLSLDDFVISFFTAGPDSTTLPILIYSSVRREINPEMHALSTLILLVTAVLIIGLERLLASRTES